MPKTASSSTALHGKRSRRTRSSHQGALRTITASVAGIPHNVATAITHEPYGAIRGWTWGNGLTRAQAFDLNGRVTELDTRNGSAYLRA